MLAIFIVDELLSTMVLPIYTSMSSVGETRSGSFWAQKLSRKSGVLLWTNISPGVQWRWLLLCWLLTKRGWDFPFKTAGAWLTVCSLEWWVVIEVSLGTTDMPQCSTWRDLVSWISSRQLKLREVVCFCRKISTPISKILPKQPEKRRKSGSQPSRSCAEGCRKLKKKNQQDQCLLSRTWWSYRLCSR